MLIFGLISIMEQAPYAPAMPRITPTIPPIRHNIIDSVKNCIVITRVFAPSDFLIPISRVRSVTETSIIFITPIPPTISEMAPTPAIKIVRTFIITSTISIYVAIFCELYIPDS